MFRARNALRWGGVTTVSDAEGVPSAGDSDSERDPRGPRPTLRRRVLARGGAAARTAGRVCWLLTKGTAVGAFRYRVTGLAAEAAFFALLSLPPLVIGLIGTMGHLRGLFGADTVGEIRSWVIEQARTVLTGPAVDSVVVPLIDDVIRGGSPDIVSVSYLISLWAGSRATNVYVDTITISYGLSGVRGVIRTRTRAFVLYLIGLLVMIVVIPMLVAGPALVRQALPESAEAVQLLYWPVVVTLSIVFLALLPRERPGADVLVARGARRRAGAADLDRRQRRPAVLPGRVAERRVGVRVALRLDRGARLAVRGGARGADRGRAERRDRPAVAERRHRPCARRAGEAGRAGAARPRGHG